MKRVVLVGLLPFVVGCLLKTDTSGSSFPGSGSSGSSGSSGGGGGGGGGNVTVPDLVGKTQSEAEAAVASAGLRGGIRIGNDPGTWNASTKVCSQTPGGGNQTASSLFVSVRMCVAERVSTRETDGMLTGMTIDEAKKAVEAKKPGLKVKVTELYEYDKDCKDGTVCRFEPRRWYIDGGAYEVLLMVNRSISISAPE